MLKSEGETRFPTIRPQSGARAVREQSISEEGTRVVGTAKKNNRTSQENLRGNIQLSDNINDRHDVTQRHSADDSAWRTQRLSSDGTQNTKVGWENEIARHILSVYASTNAQKHLKESQNLLDFVGEKTQKKTKGKNIKDNNPQKDSRDGDSDDADEKQLIYAVPQFHKSYHSHVKRENTDDEFGHTRHHKRLHHEQVIDDGRDGGEGDNVNGGETEVVGERTEGEIVTITRKQSERAVKKAVKKKKKVVRTLPLRPVFTPKELEAQEKLQAERHANERTIATLLEKISLHSAGLTESQKQYRVNNTIRIRDGREIMVRGAPKVNPIWFCSSGDVYCDWTALPGGKRLQAHLSLLYEKNMFVEYLQLLQMLLLRLYRRAAFGEESFSAGTFGLQERFGPQQMTQDLASTGNHGNSNNYTSSNRPVQTKENSNFVGGGNSRVVDHQRQLFVSSASPPRSRGQDASSQFRDYQQEHFQSQRQSPGDAWFDPLLRMQLSSPLRRQAQQRYEDDRGQSDKTADGTNSPSATGHHQRSMREERLFSPGDADYNNSHVVEPVLAIPELRLLWRQLLMAAIAIGILCTERGGRLFDRGMECFTLCDTWLKDFDELVPLRRDRKELKAFVQDAMAFYFFKRKRSLAARAFSEQAMALFREVDNAEMEAQSLLHIAAVQCSLSQFKECHETLYHFLAMVESGRLAFAQATPKQLCMVAVAYHNLAVVQLKLDAPDLACKSSQNARKIARLCLAQSNRWIDVFQYTHEVALADMKFELSTRTLDEMTPQQILLIRELAEALFAPDVVITG